MNKRLFLITLIGMFFSAQANAATVWNASLWGKPRAFTENVEKLAELVNQKTNGDFKISISYGGLSKPKENLDGITIGAFEIAQFCSFYHREKNPSITVTELPFAKNVSLKRTTEIYKEVYKHPAVVKDLARWSATLLMPSPLPQYNIVGKGDPIKVLEDFKGLRVRGPGGIMGVLGKLGAIKTGVPFSEVRQAMDSGVIDAASFAPHAHLATNDYKVAKWATTNLNLGSANCPVVVNTDSLNQLSSKNKRVLLDSVDEALDHYVENYDHNIVSSYEKAIRKEGLTLVTFNKEQQQRLNTLAESVRKEWVTKNGKSFDSQELYDFVEKLFNE